MRHRKRRSRSLAVSLGGAAASALTALAPPAQGATVLTVEPLNLGQGPYVAHQLQGALCASPNTCEPVPYPASLSALSIPTGAAALNTLIDQTSGDIIVFGYSEGAQVAGQWLTRFAGTANSLAAAAVGTAADASRTVSFVLIGNPCRASGGVDHALGSIVGTNVPADTPYQVIDVARQYDLWADFPTDTSNQLAMWNAVAGSLFIHTDYSQVDLNDPNNVTWKDGNITNVLVPTPTLPLLYPLQVVAKTPVGQLLKLDDVVQSLNARWKPIVDSAYDRPVPVPAAAASVPVPSTVPVPVPSTVPLTSSEPAATLSPAASPAKALPTKQIDPKAAPASPSKPASQAQSGGVKTATTPVSPTLVSATPASGTAAAKRSPTKSDTTTAAHGDGSPSAKSSPARAANSPDRHSRP